MTPNPILQPNLIPMWTLGRLSFKILKPSSTISIHHQSAPTPTSLHQWVQWALQHCINIEIPITSFGQCSTKAAETQNYFVINVAWYERERKTRQSSILRENCIASMQLSTYVTCASTQHHRMHHRGNCYIALSSLHCTVLWMQLIVSSFNVVTCVIWRRYHILLIVLSCGWHGKCWKLDYSRHGEDM